MNDKNKSKSRLVAENEQLRTELNHYIQMHENCEFKLNKVTQVPRILEDIIKTNPLSIQIVDGNGHNIMVNAAFTELFKAEPGPDFCLFSEPQLLKLGFEPQLKKLKDGETVFFPDHTYNAHLPLPELHNNEIHLKAVGFPVFDEKGQVERYVIIHQDITEMKRAEFVLKEFNAQIQNHKKHLEETFEEEKKEISKYIHDELGQNLTGISLKIGKIYEKTTEKSHIEELDSVLELIKKSIQRVQHITSKLRRPVIDELGIALAIESLIDEFKNDTGMNIISRINYNIEMERDISENIYRIVQESLTNIIRHSGANKVKIYFLRTVTSIMLKISDNGKGISEQARISGNSFGLKGIREYARSAGGTLSIRGKEGKGTYIDLIIPYQKK